MSKEAKPVDPERMFTTRVEPELAEKREPT